MDCLIEERQVYDQIVRARGALPDERLALALARVRKVILAAGQLLLPRDNRAAQFRVDRNSLEKYSENRPVP